MQDEVSFVLHFLYKMVLGIKKSSNIGKKKTGGTIFFFVNNADIPILVIGPSFLRFFP